MTTAALGPRIAIVDDESDVLTFLRLVLEDAGYQVLALDRGAGAAEQIEAFGPELICLDLLMPEQLGLSLLQELRERACLARVPVVILTGCNRPADILGPLDKAGRFEPPAAFLEKPVDAAGLLPLVAELIARKEP